MTEHGCKVCRVLEERGMDQYEDQLLAQWLDESDQRKGYRKLAEWFNVILLRREMDRAGLSTLGAEAESKYERLQADDAVATEVRQSLRAEGLDVGGLENDFVSYGVVRTHLKDCLGAERSHDGGDWEADTIDIARNHAASKVTEAVRSLENKGELTAEGDITVHVDVELECDESFTRVPIERALNRGYVSGGDRS